MSKFKVGDEVLAVKPSRAEAKEAEWSSADDFYTTNVATVTSTFASGVYAQGSGGISRWLRDDWLVLVKEGCDCELCVERRASP